MNKKIMLTLIIFSFSVFCIKSDLAGDLDEDINDYVIKAAESFPHGGTHKYYWPRDEYIYDGSTADVFYMNKRVMRGEPQRRCFCCGFTLEVFYKALNQYMKDFRMENPGYLTPETASEFMKLWFVREKNGDGPGDAMEKYGCGVRIPNFKEARRGDFVQLWRHSGSGHSVIFWDLILDENGNLKSMKYLSTQSKTDGIGFMTENFGPPTGIDQGHTYISRMLPPSKWKK